MKKIKITEAQANMLKEMGDSPKNKLLKVTESQYQKILEMEAKGLKTEDELVGVTMPKDKVPSNAVTKNFSKGLDSGVKKQIGKLYEEFINELYGINEDGGNTYESLIKLMEVAGLIENRKIKKGKFNNDKERVKEVITTGLYEMSKGASHYKVMETIENCLKENYLNPEFDQQEIQLANQINNIIGSEVANVTIGIFQATGLGFGKVRIKVKEDINPELFNKLIQVVESNGFKVDMSQSSNEFDVDPGERYYFPNISFNFDPNAESIDETTLGGAGGINNGTTSSIEIDANAFGNSDAIMKGNKMNRKMNDDGTFNVPVVKENAHKDTQYPGGGFVELDDCTKLNNNKVAQDGGCSQGAIDNVVTTKTSAKSVVAKENVYESVAKKTGKTIEEVKAIINKTK